MKHSIPSGDEEMVEQEFRRFGRGIYLLPNLFTTSALFAGFYAIIAAMRWQFTDAAIAVFIAMAADGLDGTIARLTKTSSSFGAEYDSLSDMVAFGIAPAIMMYSWGLHFLGKLGWLMAFCYTAAVGLRLARFNVQSHVPSLDKRYFSGLPCTLAAGLVAGFIWIQDVYHIPEIRLSYISGLVMFVLALLMVSGVHYRSTKGIHFKHKVSFWMVIPVLLLFVAIALDPPRVLFGLVTLYVISGPVGEIVHRIYLAKKSKPQNL